MAIKNCPWKPEKDTRLVKVSFCRSDARPLEKGAPNCSKSPAQTLGLYQPLNFSNMTPKCRRNYSILDGFRNLAHNSKNSTQNSTQRKHQKDTKRVKVSFCTFFHNGRFIAFRSFWIDFGSISYFLTNL